MPVRGRHPTRSDRQRRWYGQGLAEPRGAVARLLIQISLGRYPGLSCPHLSASVAEGATPMRKRVALLGRGPGFPILLLLVGSWRSNRNRDFFDNLAVFDPIMLRSRGCAGFRRYCGAFANPTTITPYARGRYEVVRHRLETLQNASMPSFRDQSFQSRCPTIRSARSDARLCRAKVAIASSLPPATFS